MERNDETKYFFELTPEKILGAVESRGLKCTGRVLPLNSMENRVYEVELDLDSSAPVKSTSERFRIVKFYRPGRWTKDQILEEHIFLNDLNGQDIPVIAPIKSEEGETLFCAEDINIYFSIFPKQAGRSPDELQKEELQRVGRLLARLHNVGASKKSKHRIIMSPETFGVNNLEFLLKGKYIPESLEQSYKITVEAIISRITPLFNGVVVQRTHGDCHLGNVLLGKEGFYLIDFDDMVSGPCVQDLWLLSPGRDEETREKLNILLEAYQSMRNFDRTNLRLIEPLRALRMIHFSAWIARRWQDPAFQKVFVTFGSERYWQDEIINLREQLAIIDEGGYW